MTPALTLTRPSTAAAAAASSLHDLRAVPRGQDKLHSAFKSFPPSLGHDQRKPARCEASPAVLEREAVSTSQRQSQQPIPMHSHRGLDQELSSLSRANLTSFEYNQCMRERMANPYEYQHELGMYYTRITDQLILGSQPQSPADVDLLVQHERVDAIVCLQQPGDAEHWGVDAVAIERQCSSLGVKHYRRSAQDFDGQSLRRELPRIVAVIAHHVAKGERVYCHCTAGLGRAPAAVIAFLFWFSEPQINLAQAYDTVTALRPCGPRRDAIRAATYDLAKNSAYQPPYEQLPSFAFEGVADWERELIRERVMRLF